MNDKHVEFVERELARRRARYYRFNTESFPTTTSLSIEYESGVLSAELIANDGQRIDLMSVKAVWYRKLVQQRLDPSVTDPTVQEFARKECRSAINMLNHVIPGRWFNHPEANRRADSRFLQWRLAHELGLSTPTTFMSNDPKAARSFIETSHRRIALKVLHQTVIEQEGVQRSMYTRLVDEAVVEQLDELRLTPAIFQHYIPKRVELRITVIGERVFVCEIDSQANPKTEIDWRRYDLPNTPHRVGTLPSDVHEKCLALTRKLQLQFGAIDMIVTPDDEYVFLEVNANGQWAWVELLTGMPLASALADLLMKGE